MQPIVTGEGLTLPTDSAGLQHADFGLNIQVLLGHHFVVFVDEGTDAFQSELGGSDNIVRHSGSPTQAGIPWS